MINREVIEKLLHMEVRDHCSIMIQFGDEKIIVPIQGIERQNSTARPCIVIKCELPKPTISFEQ